MDDLNWDYDDDYDYDYDEEFEAELMEPTNPEAFYQALKIALQIQAEAAEMESAGQPGVGQ